MTYSNKSYRGKLHTHNHLTSISDMLSSNRDVEIGTKNFFYYYNNTKSVYGVVLVNDLKTNTSAFFPSIIVQIKEKLYVPALRIMDIWPTECVCIKTVRVYENTQSFFSSPKFTPYFIFFLDKHNRFGARCSYKSYAGGILRSQIS